MTNSPDSLMNVIAADAAQGLLQRLTWMSIQPKTIAVVGLYREAFIAQLREHGWHVADEVPSGSCDLLIANLGLPWLEDVSAQINRWQGLLAPQGLLMLSAFGPETLQEWPDQSACVAQRIDMHHIGDMLVQAGLVDPVMEVEHYSITYTDPAKMMSELVDSRLVITSTLPVSQEGKWELTMEIIYGHAWAINKAEVANKDGITKIPLQMLREQLRKLS